MDNNNNEICIDNIENPICIDTGGIMEQMSESSSVQKTLIYSTSQDPYSYEDFGIAPEGVSAPSDSISIVVVILLLQALIFFGSVFTIYKIWKGVFNFLSTENSVKTNALIKILGGVDAENGKNRIVGSGLMGTILILLIAVGAMYVIGDVHIY